MDYPLADVEHPAPLARPIRDLPRVVVPRVDAPRLIPAGRPWIGARWALYLFVFAQPFDTLVLEESLNLTVAKMTGALLFAAALVQTRLCFGRIAVAFLWFFAYLAGYVVAGILVAPDYQSWWGSYAYYLLQAMVFYWIGANLMFYDGVARGSLLALAVGSCLVAFLIIAGIGTTELIDDTISAYIERRSFLGENPNAISGLCCLGEVALIGLSRGAPRSRYVAWPLCILLTAAILLTGSRGSIMGSGVGLLTFLMEGTTRSQMIRKVSFAGIAAALMVIVSCSMFMNRSQASRELRDELVPDALQMIQENPLGWGPGRARFELAHRLAAEVDTSLLNRFEYISPHNLILALLIEEGPVVSAPLLIGLWLCFRASRVALRTAARSLPLALFLTLMTLNVSHMFLDVRYFWFILAYVSAAGGGYAVFVSRRGQVP